MELITVIPRQRLPSLNLLGGSTPPLRPPARANLPLWLALLLYRQRRANILCPPWLNPPSLSHILDLETVDPEVFSPAPPWPSSGNNSLRDGAVVSPFIHSSTGDTEEGYLPFHWIEIGDILLGSCAEDIPHASQVRGLLRDIKEVRMSKLRAVTKGLEGGGVFSLRGVGAMEVCAERGFVAGVVDGLRVLGESKEEKRREDEANGEEGDNDDDDNDDMEF